MTRKGVRVGVAGVGWGGAGNSGNTARRKDGSYAHIHTIISCSERMREGDKETENKRRRTLQRDKIHSPVSEKVSQWIGTYVCCVRLDREDTSHGKIEINIFSAFARGYYSPAAGVARPVSLHQPFSATLFLPS